MGLDQQTTRIDQLMAQQVTLGNELAALRQDREVVGEVTIALAHPPVGQGGVILSYRTLPVAKMVVINVWGTHRHSSISAGVQTTMSLAGNSPQSTRRALVARQCRLFNNHHIEAAVRACAADGARPERDDRLRRQRPRKPRRRGRRAQCRKPPAGR